MKRFLIRIRFIVPLLAFGLIFAYSLRGNQDIPSEPEVNVNLSTDKSTYTQGVDEEATITAEVTDEGGEPTEAEFDSVFIDSQWVYIEKELYIATDKLSNGKIWIAYSETLKAKCGTSPYVWEIEGGTLSHGLNLNSSTGVISGIPFDADFFEFMIKVTDSENKETTKIFEINIIDTIEEGELYITTDEALPDGDIEIAYSETLKVSRGTPPYIWSIDWGALSKGLSLNSSTGIISGTPQTTSGLFILIAKVTDNFSREATKAFRIVINDIIEEGNLYITNDEMLDDGTVGVTYNDTLVATGGKPPYTWSITEGNLPDGLSLNSSTGEISGIPTTSSIFQFIAKVVDRINKEYTMSITITVENNSLPIPIYPIYEEPIYEFKPESEPIKKIATNAKYYETFPIGDGTKPTITFNETEIFGTYTGILDISDWNVGLHSIEVMVTDNRGISGRGLIEFTICDIVEIKNAVYIFGKQELRVKAFTSSAPPGTSPQQAPILTITYEPSPPDPPVEMTFDSKKGIYSATVSNLNSKPGSVTITSSHYGSVTTSKVAGKPAQDILQIYPNPSNPRTNINYSIKETGFVSIKIYNVMGQVVRTLVDDQKTPGIYTVIWNGRNDYGIELSSGVYYCRLVAGEQSETAKMLLLK